MFNALHISGSGLTVMRQWMDAVSDNIANVNTARRSSEEAFRGRMILAEADEYGSNRGVKITGVEFGDPAGRLAYEPDHPLADAQGMVRYPDIDLAGEMVHLMIAQRGFQANIAVIERARDVYQAALQLGR
jgi:flagellar basal-body rod protein FlgC